MRRDLVTLVGKYFGISTITPAEFATIDGITPGTALASKALVLNSSKGIATITSATITTLTSTTANVTTLNAGADAAAGTVNSFPATTASGKLILAAVNSAGAFNTTISNASMGQSTVVSVPDPGSATANFVLDKATATIGGAKTFSSAVTINPVTNQIVLGTTNTTTLSATAPASPRTVTFGDPLGNDSVAYLAAVQTLSGKTLTDPIIPMVVRCGTQLDRTDTTLTNISGLVVTVVPGTYRFRYNLPTTCGGTGGTKTAFKYTTTVVTTINYTSYGYTASAAAVANGTTTTDQATHIASNTAAISVEVEGTMVVGTGGTVQLQFAENSANSTSSVLVGAFMEFTRIA